MRITQSGSYQLQTNLVVTNANTTAILVTADNVTIDLNGFAIMGPNVCTGSGSTLVCNNNGNGRGIDASGKQNIKIYNGTVRGMGSVGILTGDGAVIESVRVLSNGGAGIAVPFSSPCSGSTITGNIVTGNGNAGINVEVCGIVSGNTVTGNGTYGLPLGLTVGYFNNVLINNPGANVSGGFNLGHNLCDGGLCP